MVSISIVIGILFIISQELRECVSVSYSDVNSVLKVVVYNKAEVIHVLQLSILLIIKQGISELGSTMLVSKFSFVLITFF